MDRRRLTPRLVVVVVVLTVLASLGGVVAATPPPPPAAYYGTLTVNGAPAPAGVTVTARIDGELRGQLTTGRTGAYGGPGAFEPKLVVAADAVDEGAVVEIAVGGVVATTVEWHSGDIQRLDLDVTGDVTLPTDEPPADDPPPDTGSDPGTPADPPPADEGEDPPASDPPQETDSGANETGDTAPAAVSVAASNASTAVTVLNATPNATVRIDLESDTGTNTSREVALDGLDINTTTGGDFTLNVTQYQAPPADAPPDAPAAAVGFLAVEHSIPDTQIRDVGFRFRVAKPRLASRGVPASDVVLYRYHDGAWTPLDTTLLGETSTHYRFRTRSPGLSLFAIGTRPTAPAFVITTIDLTPTTIQPGAAVRVTVTIENQGGTGSAPVTLMVDGSQWNETRITVPADDSRTLVFAPRFDTPGEYQLAVNDTAAGVLRVTAPATTTADSAPPTTQAAAAAAPDSAWPDSIGVLMVVGGVGLASVAGLVYLLRRRRRRRGPGLL